jgi:preprotein translocase subunit SecG
VIVTILTILYVISCFVLILFVLLQPGKSDAAAIFGGGANSAAFGPRGTATVLAKITITAAVVFFLIAFLFNIDGLFTPRSIGERTTQEGSGTTQPIPAPPPGPAPATPEGQPGSQPEAAPAQPQGQGGQPATPGQPAPAAGNK